MIRTRTYWCDGCKECVTFEKSKSLKCKCGKIFGISNNLSHYINMRKTWSGQTKVEFNETTIDESIKKMNKGR